MGRSMEGIAWEQSIKDKLGIIEMEDMELVVRFLSSLKYINSEKIGVYGKEYGGFLALQTLLSNQPMLSRIRCGLAVAPITDWKYSNSFLTERLLGEEYGKVRVVAREDLT